MTHGQHQRHLSPVTCHLIEERSMPAVTCNLQGIRSCLLGGRWRWLSRGLSRVRYCTQHVIENLCGWQCQARARASSRCLCLLQHPGERWWLWLWWRKQHRAPWEVKELHRQWVETIWVKTLAPVFQHHPSNIRHFVSESLLNGLGPCKMSRQINATLDLEPETNWTTTWKWNIEHRELSLSPTKEIK